MTKRDEEKNKKEEHAKPNNAVNAHGAVSNTAEITELGSSNYNIIQLCFSACSRAIKLDDG
jgi:hypothetical protein